MDYEKKYVSVIVQFKDDGTMLPREILWDNGLHYPIDRVRSVCRAPALRAGGQGDRYTICVGGRETYLFFEHAVDQTTSEKPGRWFVEAYSHTL